MSALIKFKIQMDWLAPLIFRQLIPESRVQSMSTISLTTFTRIIGDMWNQETTLSLLVLTLGLRTSKTLVTQLSRLEICGQTNNLVWKKMRQEIQFLWTLLTQLLHAVSLPRVFSTTLLDFIVRTMMERRLKSISFKKTLPGQVIFSTNSKMSRVQKCQLVRPMRMCSG